jgi:5-methylcytosine-specific restriction endonuclease McrA
MTTQTQKTCTRCQLLLPVTEFRLSKTSKDGLTGWCKACYRDNQRAWIAANKEKHQASKRAYNLANKEKLDADAKLWREKNKDKVKIYERRHYAKNGLERAYKRIERARNAEGSFTENDILNIYVRTRGLCPLCAADLSNGFQLDHIIPLSRGGTNWPDNLQLLCEPCNRSKGASIPE